MKKIFSIIFAISLFLSACKEDEPKPVVPSSDITFTINNIIQGESLTDLRKIYLGENGEKYSVSKFQYLISAISFKRLDGTILETNSINYIDAIKNPTNKIVVKNIPDGEYSEITFYFGVDPKRNKNGGLPNEDIYNNFDWPVTNGGGYHFCQLEGNFDENGTSRPYNIHLGKNPNQAKFTYNQTFSTNNVFNKFILDLNIDEFFKGPNKVVINKNLGAIMENDSLQNVFAQNIKDIFKISQLVE